MFSPTLEFREMVSRKKPAEQGIDKEVKAQITEVKKCFDEYEIVDESSRNLHYAAIARLYEYVIFVLSHKNQSEIDFVLEAAAIKRHANERNHVLPFIKLAFGKVVDTGKTKKVLVKKKTKDEEATYARWPIYKNEFDKRFNVYANYVRWLIQNEVPLQEAATRLKSETLEEVAKQDRQANPDPQANEKASKQAQERNKKYAKFAKAGGWGRADVELENGKKLPAGLVDVILDIQPDGSGLLVWVNQEPDDDRLKARVNSSNDRPKSVDKEMKKLREIAQSVSAGSTTGADSEFDMREV